MAEQDCVTLMLEKQRECMVQARAFEIWLDFLTPIRWVTIFIGVVFPALAGFSLLRGAAIFGVSWQNIATFLTFAASVVAGLHAALHCDVHQAGCKKLGPLYSSLADEFGIAVTLEDKARQKRSVELIRRLAELKRSTTETPMYWATQKAAREVPLSAALNLTAS